MTRTELARINAEQVKNKAEPVQERPQPHRRHAQAARPEGSRQAQDELLRLRRRAPSTAWRSRSQIGAARKAQGVRLPGQPAREAVQDDRRGHRVLQGVGQEADGPALRHRRHGHQGERLRPARSGSGYTAKVPQWAKAYKFEAEQGTTKLGAVEFSLGKFGELTPVAKFDPPVQLAGTTVTHASMHNASWVAEKDVRIGDTVVVEKKGEIIPQVVDVIHADRTGKEKVIDVAEDLPEVRRAGREGGDRRPATTSSAATRRCAPASWQAHRGLRPTHPHGHRRPRPARSPFSSSIPGW